MNIRHSKFVPVRIHAGFSMIDVLVAIIVLATALLALATLQGALTRNAADSRARSQLASFSEGLIEQARSSAYDCVGSAATTCATPTTNGTVTLSATQGTTAQKAQISALQTTTGVSNITVTETVATYYGGSTGAFSTTVPTTVDITTPQYKKVNVTTAWTDASGTARTVAMDSIVSPITIANDPTLVSKVLYTPGSTSQTPTVREYNPGAAPGVIPIAVSTDSNAAASNPKPEILNLRGNSSKLVGTSYNVLTYQTPDANTGAAKIQQRVETQVVACSCQYGAGSTDTTNNVFAQAFRPTYWNGTRYTVPKGLTTTSNGVTVGATNTNHPGQDPNAVQSVYCQECCRDHHDDSTAAAADPKYVRYDAFDSSANKDKTFRFDSATNTYVEVPTSDTTHPYLAACRMIRSDGLYRTATDLNSEHFGLLATQTYPNATTPVPDATTYVPKYQNFVKEYLTDKFVNNTSPNANSLYTADGLDAPNSIGLVDTSYHYLDTRGLYIDHLETEAAQAVSDALSTCTDAVTSNCVLPLLPFTTINTTELANWTSCTTAGTPCIDASGTLQVYTGSKNTWNTVTGDFVIAGYAAKAASPAASQAYAVATMTKSNSGVAVATLSVDPNDTASLSDAQLFTTVAVGAGSFFTATLGSSTTEPISDFTRTNFPTITWRNNSTSQSQLCGNSSGTTPSNPNPYKCQPDVLTAGTGTAIDLVIVGYNPTVSTTTNARNEPCATVDGAAASGGQTADMSTTQFCPNYAISSITLNGATQTMTPSVTNDGLVSESSTLSFSSLLPNDSIAVGFTRTTNNHATLACTSPLHGNNLVGTWNACP